MSSYSCYNTKLFSDIPLGYPGDQPLIIDRHDIKKENSASTNILQNTNISDSITKKHIGRTFRDKHDMTYMY